MADDSLLDRVEHYKSNALSPNTRRAYGHAIRAFSVWCRENGIDDTRADWTVASSYLVSISDRYSSASLRSARAAIADLFRRSGRHYGSNVAEAKLVLMGIERARNETARQAPALTTDDIRAIIAACRDDKVGIRDKAIILVGFAGALRRSEIVSIQASHLTWTEEGLTIFIPRSKEDQEGIGASIDVFHGADELLCPVRALRRWIECAGITAGPVFRRISTSGRVGSRALVPDSVRRVVCRRGSEAGLSGVSPHSLRSGFVTTAFKAGVSDEEILAHTRHRSLSVMRGYVRRNRLNGKAASYLGL